MARLQQLRVRLASRLSAAPAADAAFAVDLLTLQTREIWDLRLALRRSEAAALTWQQKGLATEALSQETEAYTMEKMECERLRWSLLEARHVEHKEQELCQELANEARGMTKAAHLMERRDKVQRRALEEEFERLHVAEQEVERASDELTASRTAEAKEVYALRVEVKAAVTESEELSRRLALKSADLHEPWLMNNRIPWRNPGGVFDMFAHKPSLGRGEPILRPVDFGHVCELLRRHQGRAATPAADRRPFAEFAFLAVFGSRVTHVNRALFVSMWRHVQENLEELEITFRNQQDFAGGAVDD